MKDQIFDRNRRSKSNRRLFLFATAEVDELILPGSSNGDFKGDSGSSSGEGQPIELKKQFIVEWIS